MKKKYYFIEIKERNGEQEYTFQLIRECPSDMDMDIETATDNIASTWYDDEDATKEDGGYYFFGGCLFVKVLSYQEISKKDYQVLSKYI